MDFCPECGGMIINGTRCHLCGYDINGFNFRNLKIGVPKKFISDYSQFKNNYSKLLDLILNKNQIFFTKDDILENYREIIDVANENFAYITSISPILNNTPPKVNVRKGPRDGNHEPSYWVSVTLVSRPNEPTGLTTTGATNSSTADGKIIGTTTAMEYSADNGMSWHDASNTETYVTPGTYLVRVKAISSAPHGLTSQVTVDNREIIFLDEQNASLIDSPTPLCPEGASCYCCLFRFVDRFLL